MGMFDSFYPDPPVACPACGEGIDEWQSKHRDNPDMDGYVPGDVIGEGFPITGWVEVHMTDDMLHSIDGFAVIVDGRFSHVIPTVVTTPGNLVIWSITGRHDVVVKGR